MYVCAVYVRYVCMLCMYARCVDYVCMLCTHITYVCNVQCMNVMYVSMFMCVRYVRMFCMYVRMYVGRGWHVCTLCCARMLCM